MNYDPPFLPVTGAAFATGAGAYLQWTWPVILAAAVVSFVILAFGMMLLRRNESRLLKSGVKVRRSTLPYMIGGVIGIVVGIVGAALELPALFVIPAILVSVILVAALLGGFRSNFPKQQLAQVE